MQFPLKNISDHEILSLIAQHSLDGWGQLYDKYASAMFGIIYNLTNDNNLSQEIFKAAFLQLKESGILEKVTHALCPFLLRYSNNFTRQQLLEQGIPCANSLIEESSLIDILCSSDHSIQSLALKLNSTQDDIKKQIYHEFLALRS